jgi:hypothetical protein
MYFFDHRRLNRILVTLVKSVAAEMAGGGGFG